MGCCCCWVLAGVGSRLGLGLAWMIGVPTLIVGGGGSFAFGLAGKVEKGPSCTERLLGGRPRSLPDAVLVVEGHALETAGPCLRRAREGDLLVDEGWADLGSSKGGLV